MIIFYGYFLYYIIPFYYTPSDGFVNTFFRQQNLFFDPKKEAGKSGFVKKFKQQQKKILCLHNPKK
jgi:hypothetical protein